MNGPLRPLPGARCRNTTAHPEREQAPSAAYLFTALPCHVITCRGAIFCVGHPLCVDCGAGVRDGSLVWDEEGAEGEAVGLQLITTGGIR